MQCERLHSGINSTNETTSSGRCLLVSCLGDEDKCFVEDTNMWQTPNCLLVCILCGQGRHHIAIIICVCQSEFFLICSS